MVSKEVSRHKQTKSTEVTRHADHIGMPESIRGEFDNFLRQRAVVREFYLELTDKQFTTGIKKGDSPRQELIHQIGHSRLRIEGFPGGVVKDWEYETQHADEQKKLEAMSRDELIQELDITTRQLSEIYSGNLADVHLIIMPNGPVFGKGLLAQIVQHETGHAFFTVKFCDYFGIKRLPAMIAAWGK